MKNFEKHRDEILKILEVSDHEIAAVKNGIPVLCEDIECSDCDIREGGCEGCHYEGNHILNMPCCHCERTIMDCFEPKKKSEKKPEKKTKTRQDEFLKMYPNALKSNNILMICPVEIESDYNACETYSECRKCKASYWFEEVE